MYVCGYTTVQCNFRQGNIRAAAHGTSGRTDYVTRSTKHMFIIIRYISNS